MESGNHKILVCWEKWRISVAPESSVVEDDHTLISKLELWNDKHPFDKSDDI